MASCLTCRFCSPLEVGPCAGSLWCFLRSRRTGSGFVCFDFQFVCETFTQTGEVFHGPHHLLVKSGVKSQYETKS